MQKSVFSDSYFFFMSYPKGVLYEKKKGERAGLQYVCFKVRQTDRIVEYHAFLTDDFIYSFTAYIPIENFALERDNLTINVLLDSFEADYSGGDEETLDVSQKLELDNDEEKKDVYTDGNFGWEIRQIENWTVNEYYGFDNTVTITRESTLNEDIDEDDNYLFDDYLFSSYSASSSKKHVNNASVVISVYSNPENQPLADWANEKIALFRGDFNPELAKVSDLADISVGGLDAKYYTTEVNYGDYVWCTQRYFLSKDDYRYIISFGYDQRDGELEDFLDTAGEMINSFIPGDLDYDEMGDALETDSCLITDKITKDYEGDFVKFTLPYLWNASDYGREIIISEGSGYYTPQDVMMYVFREYLDDIDDEGDLTYKPLSDYVKKMYVDYLRLAPRDMEINEKLQSAEFKGRPGYSFTLTMKRENSPSSVIRIIAVPGNDNDVYIVARVYTDLYKNTRKDKIYDQIMESLEFVEE